MDAQTQTTGGCPKCNFEVPPAAVECPACGIVFAKYQAAEAAKRSRRDEVDSPAVWRDGGLLVVARGASLPARCVLCNGPAEARVTKSLFWYPPGFYWAARLLSPLALLPALLFTESSKLDIPLCARHSRTRRSALSTGWVLLLVPLAVILVLFLFDFGPEEGLVAVLSFISALVGLLVLLLTASLVVEKRIDAEHVWLEKVSSDYLDCLPEAPSELRR